MIKLIKESYGDLSDYLERHLDSWYGRLNELGDAIEDLGLDVDEINNEYVIVHATEPDGEDVYCKIWLGGTSRTISLETFEMLESVRRSKKSISEFYHYGTDYIIEEPTDILNESVRRRKNRINEAMTTIKKKTYDTEFGSFTISTAEGKQRRRDPYTHKSEYKLVRMTDGVFDDYPKSVRFYLYKDGPNTMVTSSQGDNYVDWVKSLGATNYDNALSITDAAVVKCFQDYYGDKSIY